MAGTRRYHFQPLIRATGHRRANHAQRMEMQALRMRTGKNGYGRAGGEASLAGPPALYRGSLMRFVHGGSAGRKSAMFRAYDFPGGGTERSFGTPPAGLEQLNIDETRDVPRDRIVTGSVYLGLLCARGGLLSEDSRWLDQRQIPLAGPVSSGTPVPPLTRQSAQHPGKLPVPTHSTSRRVCRSWNELSVTDVETNQAPQTDSVQLTALPTSLPADKLIKNRWQRRRCHFLAFNGAPSSSAHPQSPRGQENATNRRGKVLSAAPLIVNKSLAATSRRVIVLITTISMTVTPLEIIGVTHRD
ncbi:hypothetical protein Bbelb_384280 [Branchiostoma belcheri]|nr:hypothetical protein Bbelb_384280 [Branchiostoma belcheri]